MARGQGRIRMDTSERRVHRRREDVGRQRSWRFGGRGIIAFNTDWRRICCRRISDPPRACIASCVVGLGVGDYFDAFGGVLIPLFDAPQPNDAIYNNEAMFAISYDHLIDTKRWGGNSSLDKPLWCHSLSSLPSTRVAMWCPEVNQPCPVLGKYCSLKTTRAPSHISTKQSR